VVDPRQSLMDPPEVAEDKRFCSVCQAEVGRSREGRPGRNKGFCAQCRTPFDFQPKLTPGTLLGGQYEVVGCLAHGGMGWIYLARDRNVNDRWVVLKGLLNSGDPDAVRAAVAEKQFLAEVEHPLIVEIYNFVTAADGASYIVMEYVGGRSLNQMLKDRMRDTGRFSPIPVAQAIAYIVEILPAFSYLHGLGLLYCDFKPANLIQVGDGIKLIDLGGVRRADDTMSPIYGTVGFQAPEVSVSGCSVASDVFTVARALAVLTFEFKGYQGTYQHTIPGPDQVSLFAAHDSLYRWLLKGTAAQPHDRFQSAEEMRSQLLGVLREVISAEGGSAGTSGVTGSVASAFFSSPAVSSDRLDWSDLPQVRADRNDPMAAWLDTITTDVAADRAVLLDAAPQHSVAVLVEQALADLHLGRADEADAAADRVLSLDPWDWRGVWIHGLVALQQGDHPSAVASFNAVYGQLPGELAPKLALARACELAGDVDVAEAMYAVCARTDANYVAPAQFGRARLALAAGQRDDALEALQGIPPTSRAFGEARRQRANILAAALDPARALDDLATASDELQQATLAGGEAADLRVRILRSALAAVQQGGPRPSVSIGGVPADERSVRNALEAAYRDAARHADGRRRIELIDAANAVRVRSLR
jgi:serine/threonine-protein kinase PknG